MSSVEQQVSYRLDNMQHTRTKPQLNDIFCILITMPGRSFLKRFSIILLSPVNRRRCTCFQFALCAVKYQGRKIGNQLILRSIACQTCNYSFSNDSSSSSMKLVHMSDHNLGYVYNQMCTKGLQKE